jgi:hypothetical protein
MMRSYIPFPEPVRRILFPPRCRAMRDKLHGGAASPRPTAFFCPVS